MPARSMPAGAAFLFAFVAGVTVGFGFSAGLADTAAPAQCE